MQYDRYTPPGTQTTIPVLANVTNAGGSVSQVASAGGWITTVVLVNTGSTTAQAHLKLFGDSGSPLTLPLTFPQTGMAATAAQVDQPIAPNALLVIQSTGPDSAPVQIGSMQLTTDGNIGGYVIFRYTPNGQEASTPFQNLGANAHMLAFDHTGGVVTGTAINNASAVPVSVPVIFRDDTGAQIGAATISLPANGHAAFGLATQFPVTANIRGTAEFDTPPGAQINVLGLRSPPSLTFTTLPPITK